MSTIEWLLLLLLAILGIGYILGSAANHRRAETAILHLQQELHPYGILSKLKPSGPRSIALRLLPRSGRVQFVDFTITLLARELLPYWLWQRLHGARDLLRVQANTQPAPNFDIRIFPLADLKSLHELQISGKPFKLFQEIKEYGVYVRGVGVPSSRDALPSFITHFGGAIQYLGIQSAPFHITVRFNLGEMRKQSYAILYQSLQEIIK